MAWRCCDARREEHRARARAPLLPALKSAYFQRVEKVESVSIGGDFKDAEVHVPQGSRWAPGPRHRVGWKQRQRGADGPGDGGGPTGVRTNPRAARTRRRRRRRRRRRAGRARRWRRVGSRSSCPRWRGECGCDDSDDSGAAAMTHRFTRVYLKCYEGECYIKCLPMKQRPSSSRRRATDGDETIGSMRTYTRRRERGGGSRLARGAPLETDELLNPPRSPRGVGGTATRVSQPCNPRVRSRWRPS